MLNFLIPKSAIKYVAILLLTPFTAMGSGYQMRYQSAETMGTAFASDVSGAKTASGFYNNPAMIAFMDEAIYMSGEFTGLMSNGEFEGSSTYTQNTGDNNTDGFGGTTIMPSIYYGQKIKDNLFVTATLTVPWATNSDYDDNWIGKYQATKTYLATVNLTPSVIYSVNDKLAISGGVQIEYLQGELGSIVDVGGIAQAAPGFDAGQDDASLVFDGDNIAYGLAFSAMFKPSEALRLGFQYRSQIKHTIDGAQSVKGKTPEASGFIASAGGQGAGLGDGQNVETEITIPDNITLGASYLLNESLDLHASLSWTGWSAFDALIVKNTDSGTSSTTELGWDDTVFISSGVDYFLSEALTLRGGLSYETGAPTDAKRTPRGVDDDRLAVALGGSFKLSELLTLHGAFTQIIFLNKPTIALNDPPQAIPQQGTVSGDFSTSASLIRLGVSAKF